MSKIETIRNELQTEHKTVFSTEAIFDREPVVPYTCDDFHKIKKHILTAQEFITDGLNGHELDDYIAGLEFAEYELSGLDDSIDSLNTEVELLRAWGQSWKDLAKQLIEDNNIDITQYSNIYYDYKEEINNAK